MRLEKGLEACLLVALLIDALLDQADCFSPWAYPITPDQQLRMTRLLLDVILAALQPSVSLTAIERA